MDGSRRIATRLSSPSSGRPDGADPVAPIRAGGPAARADEAAASDARRRYSRERMIPIDPDPAIAPLLHVGEVVLAVRRSVGLERRTAAMASGRGASGDLYLTSERLVLLGQAHAEICLNEIQEVLSSGGRLLLVLQDGNGMALAVDRPQLLRVEIAAVRAAAR